MRIAVIWGAHRNDLQYTIHHHFWDATFKDRNIQFDHYLWSEWQKMPNNYDLYFFDDWHQSLFKLQNYPYHPRVLFWTDSFHYSFVYLSELLQNFDRCYLSEFATVQGLKDNKNVYWLPHAFYPGIYRPIRSTKVHDYAFVGQFDDVVTRKGLTRKEFVFKLSAAPGLHGFAGQGVYGDRTNQIYNESKVLFDWTIANNLGTRFFETIGSGGFLLMNQCLNNGIEQIAQEGTHYVSYDGSFGDFEDKLRYYLVHDTEREKIALAGYNHFINNHTYSHRLDVILKDYISLPKMQKKPIFFDTLDILITLRCNAHCKNCIEFCNSYENTGLNYDDMDMTIEQIKLLCKESKTIWEKSKKPLWQSISLTGGELFLHPDIVEITRILKIELLDLGVCNELRLNTNLTTKPPPGIDNLLSANCIITNHATLEQKPQILLAFADHNTNRFSFWNPKHF